MGKVLLFEKPKPDVPKIIELAVDFNDMSLDAINEVITDERLSEKFRFQLAKEAIERIKRRLQTEKRRNKERMEVAKTYKEVKGAMSFFGYEMNEIKFTSSENVLLHIGSSTT